MLKVALIGSTGAVGQEFVVALNKHPWFNLTHVVSSDRSTGKRYIDAIRDPQSGILKWHNREQIPEYIRDTVISKLDDINPKDFDLIFTAVESDAAQIIEPKLATHVPVISDCCCLQI